MSESLNDMLQEYNIGYNPETIQSSWGIPQTSPFGNAIRSGFNPYYGANFEWFQFQPYYWPTDFMGVQVAGAMPPEFLYGSYFGYRGILPIGLQGVSPEPYPYQMPYPLNESA